MKYQIPVTWEVWGIHQIEADNLIEAVDKARDLGITYGGEYVDDSCEIDYEGIPSLNNEVDYYKQLNRALDNEINKPLGKAQTQQQ